jgi:hypothetical protein
MINYIAAVLIVLIIVAVGFYLGMLVGSDCQAARDQKVIDQYDRMVNERDAKIERLKIQLRCKEGKND